MMPKTNEEIIREQSGQLSIYKEEIRRLNQAIIKKNHSNAKLREKLNHSENETEYLKNIMNDVEGNSWGEDEDIEIPSPEELEFEVSENPDLGKAE